MCISIALLIGFGSAEAKPRVVAETKADVDGDGKLDTIRIEDPAAVNVYPSRGKGTAWKPFPSTRGRLVGGSVSVGSGKRYRNQIVIAATARFKSPGGGEVHQLLLLRYNKGKLTALGPKPIVGPVGRDGEWGRAIEAHRGGLIYYQTRPRVRRCDRKTAYLFPKAYDWRGKKFRSINNLVRVDPDAPRLTATYAAPAGAPAMPRGTTFRVTAVSSSIDASFAGQLVRPVELEDGKPSTAWREGAGGYGRGEFITATASMKGGKVSAIAFIPGDGSSAAAMSKSNRVRTAALLVGNQAFWIDVPDPAKRKGDASLTHAWVVLPKPIATTCVSLVIAGVHPRRARGGQTAISELAVLTDIEMKPGAAAKELARQVAAGGMNGNSAARALGERGKAGAKALLDELARPELAAPQRMRLRLALALTKDASAITELVAALRTPGLRPAAGKALAAGLTAIGAPAVTKLAEILIDAKATIPSREWAASALGDMTDASARVALVAAIEPASRVTRRIIARKLAFRRGDQPALLAEALQAATDGRAAIEATLWRALGYLPRDRPIKQQIDAAIAKRLATATGYELRHHLFIAAAMSHSAVVIGPLGAALEKTGSDQQSIALRRVTMKALDRNHAAAQILLAYAADADPGVRWHVARSLGSLGARHADKTDAALIERLVNDTWPHVRRSAAGALGRACKRPAPARALLHAVDKDKDVEVGRTALGALVDCNAKGIRAKLFAVAADRKRATDLRARAVNLIGQLGEAALRPRAIALFKRLRSEAWSRPAGIQLAAAACNTLAQLGGDSAVNTILRAAKDSTFPRLQAGCITALSKSCPRAALPVFDRYRTSSNRTVAIAAKSAARACRR